MHQDERQVAPTRAGIRRDHVARYEWAASMLPSRGRVLDLACGIGYGTQLLAERGLRATGLDRDVEALNYAQAHYAHRRATYRQADASNELIIGRHDVAVCFETIEHIEDPLPVLRALRRSCRKLIASVPNEDVFPWRGYAFHFRHYTRAEFAALLNAAGWHVSEWWGQAGPESEVEKNCMGRTIIAVAKRGKVIKRQLPAAAGAPGIGHVAILGLGPSVRQFLLLTSKLGSRKALCDEVWGINAIGDVLKCDRIYHMDDVRIQEIRAAANPRSNIAAMLAWMRKPHGVPIVTSVVHPGYPDLVPFPLEDVLNLCPNGYLNTTAACAVADAILKGATKISCWGMDFTYPDAHDAEKGRACVEFWLGVASARGIQIAVPKTSTLLDAMYPMTGVDRFYGYDCVDLSFGRIGERITVSMKPKDKLPDAEEIEHRYDHSRHPNAIVEEAS